MSDSLEKFITLARKIGWFGNKQEVRPSEIEPLTQQVDDLWYQLPVSDKWHIKEHERNHVEGAT